MRSDPVNTENHLLRVTETLDRVEGAAFVLLREPFFQKPVGF
jgi:hypothetical protein